jgi:hypothetical protein
MVVGLRVDVPWDGPDLGIDLLQEAGLAHGVFEEGAVDRGERFDRDKEVGAGGHPRGMVGGEATARDDVVEVRVVLQLPAPGMQDAGEPWQGGADEALVLGQPLEGCCRGVKHGLVGGALMGADERSQGLRDGEGHQEVRPGQLFVEVVLKPLLGFMLLALGAVPVAAGMLDTVVSPTGWARIEAMAVVAALTVLDSADDLAVG